MQCYSMISLLYFYAFAQGLSSKRRDPNPNKDPLIREQYNEIPYM